MSSAHSGSSSLRVNHSLGGRDKRSPREAVADDGVGTELADSAEDVVVQAVDDGADDDHGHDADDDAEDSQSAERSGFKRRVSSARRT